MTTSTTAPSRSPRAPRPLGTALRTVLRGVSQIFFLENSLSGALILGALALMHPWAAVTTALGSAMQALCSAVRHPDETEDDLRARAVVLGDEARLEHAPDAQRHVGAFRRQRRGLVDRHLVESDLALAAAEQFAFLQHGMAEPALGQRFQPV